MLGDVKGELTTHADDEEDLEEEVTFGVQDGSRGQRDDSQTQVLYGLHAAPITRAKTLQPWIKRHEHILTPSDVSSFHL